jgi:hypothetical protein
MKKQKNEGTVAISSMSIPQIGNSDYDNNNKLKGSSTLEMNNNMFTLEADTTKIDGPGNDFSLMLLFLYICKCLDI